MDYTLQPLIQYLNSLQERADVALLESLLHRTSIGLDEVHDFLKFGDDTYKRNLICSSPWYELLLLCWKEGQSSAIHDHNGSSCGVRVLRGIAAETRFQVVSPGRVRPAQTTYFHPGYVCVSREGDIHQISQDSSGGPELVTLHIYSPPLQMNVYELDDVTLPLRARSDSRQAIL